MRRGRPEARRSVSSPRTRYPPLACGIDWEDSEVVCRALAPVAAGGRLLATGGAGDVALSLLLLDPTEVTAADSSPTQRALLELKIAAIRHLSEKDLGLFLGAAVSERRLEQYDRLRSTMRAETRDYWDARKRQLAAGVISQGRVERRLYLLKRWLLPLLGIRQQFRGLRSSRSPGQKAQYHDQTWDGSRWRNLTGFLFSEGMLRRWVTASTVLEELTDEEFSAQERRFRRRFRYVVSELPVQTNPFLAYLVTGGFPAEARPLYLAPGNHALIRSRLDRLRWSEGRPDFAARGAYDGIYLGALPDSLPAQEREACLHALCDRLAPAGRLVYWRRLLDRHWDPASLQERLEPLAEEAKRLLLKEQTALYHTLSLYTTAGVGDAEREEPEAQPPTNRA